MSYCTRCRRPVDDTCDECPIAFGPDHDVFIIDTDDRINGQFAPGHPYIKSKLGRRKEKGKYILGYKARRKDAKRHIIGRYDELEHAKNAKLFYEGLNNKYHYHIYNSQWEVIE